MEKRTGVVTFAGNPIALLGKEVKVGDKAPAFTLLDNGLGEKTLADYAGKVKVISVVPSLDTGVCDAQTRWFNQNVSKLGENVETVSDHRDLSFGENYGFSLEGLRLLSRGIVVIDKDDVIRYVEYVPEVTSAVNFDAAEAATKALV